MVLTDFSKWLIQTSCGLFRGFVEGFLGFNGLEQAELSEYRILIEGLLLLPGQVQALSL